MFKKIFNQIRKNKMNLVYNLEKEYIINSIKSGGLSELFKAYLLLFSEDKKIINDITELFKYLIEKENIVKLEESFRMSIYRSMNYNYNNWTNTNFGFILENDNLIDSDKIILLGFSSFHANGYYREKALKELGKYNTGEELKFINMRINDWVTEINELATKLCLNRINQNNISCVFDNIPYFIKLSELNRYNHQKILTHVDNLFKLDNNKHFLLLGINDKNPQVRRYFYRLLLNNNKVHYEDIINNLILEKEPYLKHLVLFDLIQKLSKSDFLKIYPHFINDKNSQIRLLILYTLNNIKVDEFIKIIYPFLFDSSKQIREYARLLLKDKHQLNFGNIYRNELMSDNNVYGSINGLTEVGNKTDLSLIKKFLNHNKIKIIKATLNSIARLDFENNKNLFINYLIDERIGVSKTAYLIIKKNIYSYLPNELYDIYKNTNFKHAKMFSSNLLISLSKWNSLKYILELLKDEDEYINYIAKTALHNWNVRYNKSFISPTTEQIKDIKLVLDKTKDLLKKEECEFLFFSLKDYVQKN